MVPFGIVFYSWSPSLFEWKPTFSFERRITLFFFFWCIRSWRSFNSAQSQKNCNLVITQSYNAECCKSGTYLPYFSHQETSLNIGSLKRASPLEKCLALYQNIRSKYFSSFFTIRSAHTISKYVIHSSWRRGEIRLNLDLHNECNMWDTMCKGQWNQLHLYANLSFMWRISSRFNLATPSNTSKSFEINKHIQKAHCTSLSICKTPGRALIDVFNNPSGTEGYLSWGYLSKKLEFFTPYWYK